MAACIIGRAAALGAPTTLPVEASELLPGTSCLPFHSLESSF